MSGRRPTDGSFPACPTSGVCQAESVRTHGPCRNCALSPISLQQYLAGRGTNQELAHKIQENCTECVDLWSRLVEARNAAYTNPPVAKIVLDIYHGFGKGDVAQLYLGTGVRAPRPQDQAHARMILEELGLTCYTFNKSSDRCSYVEDLIYCRRHTPILSIHRLRQMCAKYDKQKLKRERNGKVRHNKQHLLEIKEAIVSHEKKVQATDPTYRENVLRRRFNAWLRQD